MGEKAGLELRVLGPFEASADGRRVDLGGPQLRGALARLLVDVGRTVSVRALVHELWGECPPLDASRTVRTYMSRLRTALRRASTGARFDLLLVTCAPGYRLLADPDMFDAARFERLAATGRHALAAEHPQLAHQRFTEALSLWRGDAFVEFDDHPAISAEGTRLNQLRLMVIEDRIQAALATGRDTHVVGELETLVLAHPARERLWGQLMTALYRCGRQAEALAAFRTARAVLVREYGVEPSPRLVEIHRRILQHDIEPAAPWPIVAA